MTSDAPEGRILGPVLPIIYINNLPDCVSSKCIIFADDTKLCIFSSKSSALQIDLESLQRWCDCNLV